MRSGRSEASSPVPNEAAAAPVRTQPLRTSGVVRIAIGGTLQPRKRQLEELEMAKRIADEYHKQFMLEAIKMVLTTSALMVRCSPT